MLGCGVFFAALGWLLVQRRLKAHFEPYAAHLGWLLVLGAMLSWLFDDPAGNRGGAALLLAVATAAGLHAARRRHFPRFAIAVAGAYAGLSVLMVGGVHSETVILAWFTLSSIALIFGLIWARARLRDAG